MKIAIVGAGISGLTCAHYLAADHEVDVFEADDRIGGHTDTHSIEVAGKTWRIDSGFIVFNEANYPNFNALLDELDVESQPTAMSFGAMDAASGMEYNATDLNSLFCQRRNILSPRFLSMVSGILRFYKKAPALLKDADATLSTGDYLRREGYSDAFIHWHLVPMASALWSAPPKQIMDFPIRYMVEFFANHRMLQVEGRPEWRVIKGGSATYVEALQKRLDATVHTSTPVRRVRPDASGLMVETDTGEARYDRVIFACHSDQALTLLEGPSTAQADVLRAIRYQDNDIVVHGDTSIMPDNPKAWAAWNAHIPKAQGSDCTVTYCMNILQGLTDAPPFLVSLNNPGIDEGKIYARRSYAHPVYSQKSVAAQRRFFEIDGVNNVHFCGAYWGWGFHEDGVRSALRVVERIRGENRSAA